MSCLLQKALKEYEKKESLERASSVCSSYLCGAARCHPSYTLRALCQISPQGDSTGLCNEGLYIIYITEREQHELGPLDHLGKISGLPSLGFSNCVWSPHAEVLDHRL